MFLGIIGEQEMCPVMTLWTFLNESKIKRTHLPEDHTLFLAYVDSPIKHASSVRPVTIANWVKSHMERASIDTTKFIAHSIRAAASTRAVQAGIPIQTVKLHAGWSLRTSTFEEVYLKPREQQVHGQQILETMFSWVRKSNHIGGRMVPHYSCVRNDTQLLVGGMRTRMWWPFSQEKIKITKN
jgi:hypothetical protein